MPQYLRLLVQHERLLEAGVSLNNRLFFSSNDSEIL